MVITRIIHKTLDHKNLTLAGFTLLVYVSLFGAQLPFNYQAGQKDGTASNTLNQLFYFVMFALGTAVLLIKYHQIFSFIIKEKFVSLFVLFSLSSVLWADFPLVSLIRTFQLFVAYLIIVNTLLFLDKDIIINRIRSVLVFYILITLFAIFFIPEAIDPLFSSPRGLTLQKNQFGQVMNLVLLMFLFIRKSNQTNKYSFIDISAIFISIILIILSKSTTALVSMIIIFALQSVFLTDRIFEKLHIGKIISTLTIVLVIFFAVYFSINSNIVEKIVSDYLGKDLTFTGRTDHWKMMLLEIQKHPVLGVGYSSFWDVPGSEYRLALIGNSAHNGYIEILNELGIVGFMMMFIMFLVFFYRASKISSTIYIITIITVLVLGFSESTLLREKGPSTFVTLFVLISTSYEYFYKNYNGFQ